MYTIHPSAMQLLLPLYNSSLRSYHDFNHIQFCLSKLSEYDNANRLNTIDRITTTYAIWFHDAIYSPYKLQNTSNEKESADLFLNWAKCNSMSSFEPTIFNYENNLLSDFFHGVYEAISATENHIRDLTSMELDVFKLSTLIMLDVDMSGFSKPLDIVYKDSQKIFEEYSILGISHVTMLENRIKFLETLLNKKRIYVTDYFYETQENIARVNIKNVIELSLIEINDKLRENR